MISPDIRDTHDKILHYVQDVRTWLGELASGTISDDSRERIRDWYPPGIADFDDGGLDVLGKAAEQPPPDPGNPRQRSHLARAFEIATEAEWFFKNQVTDRRGTRDLGRSDGEIIAKSREVVSQLAEFSDDVFRREAAAASTPGGQGKCDEVLPGDFVTLLQMATIVQRSKKTLGRLYTNGTLPAPQVEGGVGKANEWSWAEVRPILEKAYQRSLPESYPADRFIRST